MANRQSLVVVSLALVLVASLAKVGFGIWRHRDRRAEPGPVHVGYYTPGSAREIRTGDDKKVKIDRMPIVGSEDFDAAFVEPLILKTTELDPGSTYYSILLLPRPEAAVRIAAHRATPVLVVLDDHAGSSVPAPLGDFDVQGRLLLASFPDERSAKEVLVRVAAGLKK